MTNVEEAANRLTSERTAQGIDGVSDEQAEQLVAILIGVGDDPR